jgi:HSP20 family protein
MAMLRWEPFLEMENVLRRFSPLYLPDHGERKLEREDQGENAIRIESVYGAFARSFVLPDYVDAKNIHAESKDGVPRIHVPKAKTKKSEPLAIEVH